MHTIAQAMLMAGPIVASPVVVSLLHGGGTNGSSVFTDEVEGVTWSLSANPRDGARISNTFSKWGTTSIREDQDDAIFRSSAIVLPGDFTFEAWVYLPVDPASAFGRLIFAVDRASDGLAVALCARADGPCLIYDNDPIFYHAAGSSLVARWVHIHGGRSGTSLYLGCDGATSTVEQTAPSVTYDRAYIGGFGLGVSAYTYLNDIRITTGSCRYTGAYTVPTAQFPPP